MNDHSELISKTLGIMYPFILMIGLYITLNGHISPGGGFQGGAVLASVYIAKYFILPKEDINMVSVQLVEKAALILIILIPIFFLYTGMNAFFRVANVVYSIGLNGLIAIKVACGMTIIFYRFVYYEAR